MPPSQTQHGSGMSKFMTGIIILVVVMVLAGAGTYFGVGSMVSTTSGSSHSSGCSGAGCVKVFAHDVSVFSPFASAQTLSPVTFTATIPSGVLSSTTFFFGDGANQTVLGATATATHSYTSPGAYYIYVEATDTSGGTHDNLNKVTSIQITPSSTYLQSGEIAVVSGLNTTPASISAGGSVTLQGSINAPPSATGWTVSQVGFLSPSKSITLSKTSFANTTTSATVIANVSTSATNGVYSVIFFTESTDPAGSVAWGNYTFSIGVGVKIVPPIHAVSPNPGTANVYYLVPGGSFSEDPAIDYETAGYEPILNTYQTLISYNGSLAGPSPGSFVPNLATCVPGSAMCASMYGGSTLQSGSNYTFVINPSAEFYNPHNGHSANVYPIDVLYSLARTCLFSTWPSYETNPGWIQCQSFLPAGNPLWDSGMHAPLNSTPSNILAGVEMNVSGLCPSSATNGCITINTAASGETWPYFLELFADPLGGSVMDCNYLVSVGNVIPGLSCGATTNPTGIAATAWDSVQTALATPLGDYVGTSTSPIASWANDLRWDIVGSGPYYLDSLTPGTSYTIKVNPDWTGTTCHWAGCLPTSWTLKTVNVVWESSPVEGEAAFENGKADLATIPATDFSSVLLPLLHDGLASVTSAPGLSIFFTYFDQYFSQTGAQSLLPSGTTLNAPSTLFQDLAFRQFLTHAYPYATVQSTYNTIDGIPLDQLYGGAIPIGMGNYYPTNISWDMKDPSTATSSPNDAGYWWALVQSENGIAAKACLASKPCVFPLMSYAGAPLQDEIQNAWVAEISSLSGGAVDAVPVDIPFINLVINSFSSPGTNPMPMFVLGWAPDYPDPTDYIGPMYTPDGTYTYGSAFCEAWIANSTCPTYATVGSTLAAANYDNPCTASNWIWGNASVTTSCQGYAYYEMAQLIKQAAFDPDLSQRAFLYNEMEHIAQQLAIFVPNPGQAYTDWITASWINGATMNQNPTIGGGGDSTWYTVTYT